MPKAYLPGATSNGMEVIMNDIGKGYEDSFGHDPGLHRIVERYLTYLPPNASVLDCGSGTGKPVCYMVAESGRRVVGIDVSEKMIQLSREQVPRGTFELCSMLEYSPPPASLGGITATLSLFALSRAEHTSMVEKWFQWLRPGGYLLIGVIGAEDANKVQPSMYDPDGECVNGADFTFMGYNVYLTLFTKAAWIRLLESRGFAIVHTEVDRFQPSHPQCDEELHYFVIAKKPEAV